MEKWAKDSHTVCRSKQEAPRYRLGTAAPYLNAEVVLGPFTRTTKIFALDSGVSSRVYTLSVCSPGLRIGEVARRAGVSVDTIRYYEKRKLLPPSPRSQGGFRLFTDETIERVRFIIQAQEMGFSLNEIRTLLTGGVACGQMRDLLKAKLEQISERMKALRAFTNTLVAIFWRAKTNLRDTEPPQNAL